jgi:hypothetical protein
MIPVTKDKVTTLHKALKNCGGWPCSNQGRPFDGWEIILDINGVPAIIREDRQDALLSRSKHLLELNKKDHKSASFIAHFCLTILMQCDPNHQKFDLAVLLGCMDFGDNNAAQSWSLVGDATIGQILTTQEFHKPVLERMWRVWMSNVLDYFGIQKIPSKSELFNPLFVRSLKTKEQMVEAFEKAKESARNNTLPSPALE